MGFANQPMYSYCPKQLACSTSVRVICQQGPSEVRYTSLLELMTIIRRGGWASLLEQTTDDHQGGMHQASGRSQISDLE